jgi:hypothetical protein
MEKEYLAFLARDYARQFRVTPITSLFDYGIGQSTFTYTDESFPRVHRTVNDLSPDRQTAARVKCEENGIRGDELKGCIFDQAYLEIPPSPRPLVVDRTNNIVLSRIDRPVNNVNGGNVTKETVIPTSRDNGQPQPIQQNPETNRAKPVGAEVNPTSGTLKPSNSTKPTSVESNPTVEKPIEFEMKPTSTKPTNTKPAGIEVKPSSSKPSGSGTTTPVNTTPVKTTPTMKGGKG